MRYARRRDGRVRLQADDTELYDVDRVHPSVEGSRVVGEYVADAILAAEGN